MGFSDTLNTYIGIIGCTSKKLSETSGVTASTLSRYRSGERVPSSQSQAIGKIAHALVALDENALLPSEQHIKEKLIAQCTTQKDATSFSSARLNQLMNALQIENAALSRTLNYDASYISRVRNGFRIPTNRQDFAQAIGKYIERHYAQTESMAILSRLLDLAPLSHNVVAVSVAQWLTDDDSFSRQQDDASSGVHSFLSALDSFDLGDYLKALNFDQLKLPTAPFRLPVHKHYYGLEGMREASLDFEKAVATSSSPQHVLMCSTMPMEDMAEDADFPKKWLFGLACMIKRGATIDMIHDLNRPFREMLMGLEAYLPLYMTGQVNPWYFPDASTQIYYHHDWIAENIVLTGEAIVGAHKNGRYYLTNEKSEMPYFQQRAADMLAHAAPAMRIFTQKNRTELFDFMGDATRAGGLWRNGLTTAPLCLLDGSELESFIASNDICTVEGDPLPVALQKRILDALGSQKRAVENILRKGEIELRIPFFKQDAAAQVLFIPEAFIEEEILCASSVIDAAYRKTESFAQEHEGFSVVYVEEHPFRNMHMLDKSGEWVLVSKTKAPLIHILFEHPALREAFERYEHPIVD